MAAGFQQMIEYDGEAGRVPAWLSRPKTDEPRPTLIVVHALYGVDNHIKDVANRFAREGYVALAPHLFARPALAELLTPENIGLVMPFVGTLDRDRLSDQAYVEQEMAGLPPEKEDVVRRVMPVLFGGLPKESLTQDLVRGLQYLSEQSFVQAGKMGSVGFCFGGGMSINLACTTPLAACVVFYGENPSPTERVANIAGPVLGLYGADDRRINSRLHELVQAMADYRQDFEMRIYPGAAHAFFDDTRPSYREAAATEAWERVLRFYRRTLA
jgi:carboxymethylenebutenolidase